MTRRILLVAVWVLLVALPAAGQDKWPSRTITIVGGFPTGAGTDIYSRMLAEPLSKALGVSVIVDNKSGAGGNVGSEFVARARPDGYTLYFGTAGTHAINVTLYGKLPFDVIKDFSHISILGDVPNIMIVNPKVMPNVNSCADVMKLAKEKPGQLKYASTGNGASTHLAGAIFTKMSGLVHVFCHRELAYRYSDQGVADWMARNFFTGGIMPSADLPIRIPSPLRVAGQWRVAGLHSSRTLESWLERMDSQRARLMPLFREVYGGGASRWFERWRMFFMACSESFRYRCGTEWFVSQYLLRPSGAASIR